ncbi:MAG: hypothetical protein IT375_11885 [Polyangiaceae bacterium]|nr:hypothetical protein [Polyangiaceae bacterium]
MSGVVGEVKTVRSRTVASGLSRHVEGWQPALVAVAIAATFALLVVPRPAAPDTLPLPSVDAREQARSAATSRALATRAAAEPLPYLVRALGETLRAFGKADVEGRSGDAARKLIELRGLAQTARAKHGDESVQALLGLQTELFLSAIARWEARQPDDGELAELGGAFLDKAKAAGWLAGERRLAADEHERRALFKLRWVEATGLRSAGGFAPTANELRVYYRFLLAHSAQSTEEALRQIGAVEKVDLEYPGQFARGVVHYRGGQFGLAAEAFQAHLTKHPTGPWALRAKNHLLAAAERTRETTPAP